MCLSLKMTSRHSKIFFLSFRRSRVWVRVEPYSLYCMVSGVNLGQPSPGLLFKTNIHLKYILPAQYCSVRLPVHGKLVRIFVLQYTGREKWLTQRNILLLAIMPFLAVLLAWTNERLVVRRSKFNFAQLFITKDLPTFLFLRNSFNRYRVKSQFLQRIIIFSKYQIKINLSIVT